MNGKNNITETAEPPHLSPDWLANEVRSRHLPLESNATPGEIIPFVQKFIKRHLELGTVIPQGVDSYPIWKATLDDWQQFLATLNGIACPSGSDPQPGEFDKHTATTKPHTTFKDHADSDFRMENVKNH